MRVLTPSIRGRIFIEAETRRERKYRVLTDAAIGGGGYAKHILAFDEDGFPPTARMTGLTAMYHRTPISCVSLRANWRFLIPITHLIYEQLVGLVTGGLLVVAVPAGKMSTNGESRRLPLYRLLGPGAKNETGGGRRGKVLSSPRWGRHPTPLLVSHTNTNEAVTFDKHDINYLARTSEKRSWKIFEAHCASNNDPFFIHFFILLFFILLFVLRSSPPPQGLTSRCQRYPSRPRYPHSRLCPVPLVKEH